MNSTTFTTIYIVGAVLTIAYLVVLHLLFERLADRHLPTWELLGSPRSFSGYTLGNFGRIVRFVWRRQFLALNDPLVSALSIAAFLLLVAGLGISLTLWFYAGSVNAPAA
jgi:hypothetical protein